MSQRIRPCSLALLLLIVMSGDLLAQKEKRALHRVEKLGLELAFPEGMSWTRLDAAMEKRFSGRAARNAAGHVAMFMFLPRPGEQAIDESPWPIIESVLVGIRKNLAKGLVIENTRPVWIDGLPGYRFRMRQLDDTSNVVQFSQLLLWPDGVSQQFYAAPSAERRLPDEANGFFASIRRSGVEIPPAYRIEGAGLSLMLARDWLPREHDGMLELDCATSDSALLVAFEPLGETADDPVRRRRELAELALVLGAAVEREGSCRVLRGPGRFGPGRGLAYESGDGVAILLYLPVEGGRAVVSGRLIGDLDTSPGSLLERLWSSLRRSPAR